MADDRRVLVITYYFPPSGGPGVQRVLKFVKYLPEVGWQPTVLTVQEGAFPEYDPTLVQDIPSNVPIHRTQAWDPFRLYARLTGRTGTDAVVTGSVKGRGTSWKEALAQWIRANVFLPDARVGWVPFGVLKGRQLLKQQPFDIILTSGPPHSVHLIGGLLRTLRDVPWLADFRDPWTDINYYQELPHTPLARRVDAALERWVLRRASMVTTVSPSWKALLAKKARGASTRFAVIQNGYDEDDFDANAVEGPGGDHFILTYVGSLYTSRNPTVLWAVLQRLRAEGAVPALRIRVVGKIEPDVRERLRQYDLEAITEFVSYVPHEEAIAYMQRAALLWLVIESHAQANGESHAQANGTMTGKIYEYLASGRPVLGIGPHDGDAAALLREVRGGDVFERNQEGQIAQFIKRHYNAWAAGRPVEGASPEAIRPYSRRAQTERLADVLNRVQWGPAR